MTYDLVIRNGRIVDGSGLASYRADVGVRDGRIATIGRITERGRNDIDAEGHVVTPGFIDCHTHMDAQIFWDPVGANSCWHGVTTALMGNCGFTIAPGSADQRDLLVRNVERAEDISGAAMAEGIDWTWSDFAQYQDALDALPKGINYAAQVGHSAIRCHVMGERAFTDPADDDDLARMTGHLRLALESGAWGFTTSRTIHHQTPDGSPVASRLATWDEVEHLLRTAATLGRSAYQYVEDVDPERRAEREAELVALAAETGLTFVIAAIRDAERTLAFLDRAAAAGANYVGVTHPRGICNWSSFLTRTPFDGLAEWQEVRSRPVDEQRVLLKDPAVRERLAQAALQGDFAEGTGAEARRPDYDQMRVLVSPTPPWPTVNELAAERGVDPVTLILELAAESDLDRFFVQPLGPFDPDDVARLLAHPRTVTGFSDSGAHVSQMADASITTHHLAYWVRQQGVFGFEEAVRSLTLAPARAWGFHDRGLVQEGFVADLNVIDPATVAPAMPRIVEDLPAGEKRIEQRSTGILATVVNGVALTMHGEHTGAHPGRLLRRRAAG